VTYGKRIISQSIYRSDPHSVEELNQKYLKGSFPVSQEEAECVDVNVVHWCQQCIQNN
jgi:hypothetical protein